MTFEVGDKVINDREVDERGFREETRGEVEMVLDDGQTYIVLIDSIFAYHPCNRAEGRDLPVRGRSSREERRRECYYLGELTRV